MPPCLNANRAPQESMSRKTRKSMWREGARISAHKGLSWMRKAMSAKPPVVKHRVKLTNALNAVSIVNTTALSVSQIKRSLKVAAAKSAHKATSSPTISLAPVLSAILSVRPAQLKQISAHHARLCLI